MRLLFIGDVVGGPGRRGLRETMPSLRERYEPDLIVVNGENSAGGMGITERTANDILDTGASVITSGNHVYRHRDAYPFLERAERVIRPANYPSGNPGRGHTVVGAGGMRVGVVNLSGAIGLISCYKGFTCGSGASGVGRACTESFVTSFIVVMITNFFMAKLLKDLYEQIYGIRSLF